jgi:hypothetical protein
LSNGFATAQQNIPQESQTPIKQQSIPAPHSSSYVEKEPHDALKNEGLSSKEIKEKKSEHAMLLWTLIITAVGVAAGLAAFIVAWLTILEAQRQARENAKTARAQFWILLRGVFAFYDDIHARFRPGGEWHDKREEPYDDGKFPKAPLDMARTELYMGLYEYCYRLLNQGLIDQEAFSASYKYRLENLVNNRWVSDIKLGTKLRKDWKDFKGLCDRLNVEIPKKNSLTDKQKLDLGVRPELLNSYHETQKPKL